jgi:hypothetical protein
MISAIVNNVQKGRMESFSQSTSALATIKRLRKPRKNLYIATAIGASLIVLTWIAVEARLFKGEIEQVMTALNIYTDTLIQHDYESAYQITSPTFREAVSYSALVAEQAKLNEEFGALKNAKQTDWDIDSINDAKSAIVKVNLQFERGSSDFQFSLHKEDGIWRVFSYKEADGTAYGKN